MKIPFKTENGVLISLLEFFEIKGRGLVFTGTVLEVEGHIRSISSVDLYDLLKGQILFGKPIIGIEMFATMSQNIPCSVGLLVEFRQQ